MADRVRLLLDVDGVLNAVGSRCPDWQEWNAAKRGASLINYSLEVGRAIAELDVDVVWLSTWRQEANEWFGPLFGWPEHAVIAVNDEEMLSWRSWWKFDAAKRLYAEEPSPSSGPTTTSAPASTPTSGARRSTACPSSPGPTSA